MINDDRTGWCAGPRGSCRSTLFPCDYCSLLPCSHLQLCPFLKLFLISPSQTRSLNRWSGTLCLADYLVGGLNDTDARCCSPLNATCICIRTLRCRSTVQHAWVIYVSRFPFSWPPKTSKCVSKLKASKYKILCIRCHTEDVWDAAKQHLLLRIMGSMSGARCGRQSDFLDPPWGKPRGRTMWEG